MPQDPPSSSGLGPDASAQSALLPLPGLDAEEAFLLLQDVLTEVSAGRIDGHRCPHCDGGTLQCAYDEARDRIAVTCPSCRLHFSGVLAGGYG